MGLCEELSRLTTEAELALADESSVYFGPIPLTIKANGRHLIQSFDNAFLSSTSATWSPLQISLLSKRELSADRFPVEIRPRDQDALVAYGEEITAFSSGSESILWLFQSKRAAAVLWIDDFERLPPWERSSPLRAAARWWSARHRGAMVHAGVVGDETRCLLLVGAGGAGKSTSTLACLNSDLQVLGDDYCLIQTSGAAETSEFISPIAFGMYRHAKLDQHSLELLPALRSRVIGPAWRGKWLVDLGITHAPPLKVAGVCHVIQDSLGPTRFEPISRIQALRALAPSTLFQQRLWEKETWQALTSIIRTVPCFQLLVNNPLAIPDQVHGLLSRIAS